MKRYFFHPDGPLNLGVCRCLWFGSLVALYLTADFSLWGEVDPIFWQPIWVFHKLGLAVVPTEMLAILQTLWKLSLVLACVGLFTRPVTVVAFVLGFYLLGLQHNWGKTYHGDAVVVLTLAIFALSRCGDAFSLDAWRRGKPALPSGEYRWPVRAVWIILSLMFFASGVAKLRISGLEWMNGENLSILLIQHQYYYGGMAWTKGGLYLAQYEGACAALSVATVALECGLVLALFHPYLRAVLVPSALAMMVGFPLLLGPFAPTIIVLFLFWVPWDRLLDRASRNSPPQMASL